MMDLSALKFEVVRGAPAPFRCTKDALAWARANGLIGKMSNEETGGKGVVSISGESIRETLNPRQREKSVSDDIHFAALVSLRKLIHASVILDVHPDYQKNADGVRISGIEAGTRISIVIAYAAFMVLGVVYRVRLTLKRYAQTGASKAYAYRVNEIEVLPGTLGGRIALATDPTGTTSICGNILLNGVCDVNGVRLDQSSHPNLDASSSYRLTPSEIEQLRRESHEAGLYARARWAHLRPQK